MMKKKLLILLFVTLLAISLSGCGTTKDSNSSGSTDQGTKQEYIGARGEITELYLDENKKVMGFMVEGESERTETYELYDKASVSITEDTKIMKGNQALSVEDLKEGMKVMVIFEGEVRESYPVQVTAKSIEILE